MPARASRKLVIDLSTQRSIARASFQTSTPFSRKAWRMPSRSVTAWKVPPDIERTNTASGSRSPSPAMLSPDAPCVSIPQACRLVGIVRTPCAANAFVSVRACQSIPSATSATIGAAGRRLDRRACYANEASSSFRSMWPLWKLSPLSMAVTITSAGLNSMGSIA